MKKSAPRATLSTEAIGTLLRAGIERAMHRQLHVGLARTQPDIAHQHVLDPLAGAAIGGDDKPIGSAGRQGGQHRLPVAIAVGAAVYASAGEVHRHAFAGPGLPPRGDRTIALQHGVIREHGMQQR